MKLLIDECLPRGLKKMFAEHECRTVREMGWSGRKNGALLALAEKEFDVLVTIPKGSAQIPRRIGLVLDDVYLKHLSADTGHPERPERLTAIRSALEDAGLFRTLHRIKPRAATQEELALAHSAAYLALAARELSGLHGLAELSTGDTLISPGSLEAAKFAAGGVLQAVDGVMAGNVNAAFCAVRPPGHHATRARGMGFCIFNNAAAAARYVQQTHSLKRVLIVDWDYHHGNGTQDIFYEDGSVFYFSTHHFGAYPGTGHPSETGAGRGSGTTLNVPVPPGASDEEILQAFESELVPAVRRFRPDFVLISAGFDGMRNDLLGCFDITPQGFAAITRVVATLADEFCQGRIVSVLEGGYRLDGLGQSVAAHSDPRIQKRNGRSGFSNPRAILPHRLSGEPNYRFSALAG